MGNMQKNQFNVLILGAGEINFGSLEGPWNHSLRLESKLPTRLNVVALIDVDTARAQVTLDKKLQSDVQILYQNCKIFGSVEAARGGLADDSLPRLAVIGAPPHVRGSDIPGFDLELQVTKAFPNCALFVEKPVSSGSEERCWRVAQELTKRHTLVGVGYMLRYLKAVQQMKQIIRENNLVVMGTNARYLMAYEYACKTVWWDKALSGGPVIEQATHFCDLSRYFGGDVNLSSVVSHTVEHDEAPGKLSLKPVDEGLIQPENRLPRLTSATWKYKGGAVGNLTHAIVLHGTTYDTEFEVYADGYKMRLVDPYGTPKLYVRRPGHQEEVTYTYEDDDPFYTEMSTFIDVVENNTSGQQDKILSSYEDAVKTYEFTWQIRRASEKFSKLFKGTSD